MCPVCLGLPGSLPVLNAAAVEIALRHFGRLDVVVNNAGILRDRMFVNMTEDEWDIVLAVHLKGAYNVTRPALAAMKEKNYGRVIFTSSGVGLYGNFGQTSYAAAKAGVIGMTKVWARELSRYNIRVNAVAPGLIETEMTLALPPVIAGVLFLIAGLANRHHPKAL